jgi:glutamate formiminotransferase
LFGGMTAPVLEAVPNFSEGRDRRVIGAIVEAMRAAGGAVLDWSADADHHRSVVTVVGSPAAVEEAAIAGARVAIEHIDLRRHQGVHPRIGAVDVLPFVPLLGLSLSDARLVARRVGERIAHELGIPIFYYGEASDPPGRTLPPLRLGGYERLVQSWPEDRKPDVLPAAWQHAGAHPTAGATCVGARKVLLAWNVRVDGLSLETTRDIARGLREQNSGLPGVRARAHVLPSNGTLQISMNLEDPELVSPLTVFRQLKERVRAAGGRVVETEVVGLVPDALALRAAEEQYALAPGTTDRLLSRRLAEYLAEPVADT